MLNIFLLRNILKTGLNLRPATPNLKNIDLFQAWRPILKNVTETGQVSGKIPLLAVPAGLKP